MPYTPLANALNTLDALRTPENELIVAKCRGLMAGYDARWLDAPYTIQAVESLSTSDLWNPETNRKSRSFTIAGLLDVTGRHITTGRQVIFDHKTTSDDIEDAGSPYWKQLVIEGQVSQYMMLEWLNGRKVDEAVWDVMRKPGISPKGIAKKDLSWTLSSGYYFGRQMSDKALASLRETGREDMEMYEARLANDCTELRPNHYFQRRTVPRLDAELHEYGIEMWGHSKDMLYARTARRWPRNSGACMLYGSPCKFLGICSNYDTEDSEKWKRKDNVHSELPMLEGDGRDVLTNSRIRCFQTCRRKHYYQYELGIDRQDAEEREALIFGTLWHKALEAWFKSLKEETTNDNATTDSPENGFGTVTSTTTIDSTGADLDYF